MQIDGLESMGNPPIDDSAAFLDTFPNLLSGWNSTGHDFSQGLKGDAFSSGSSAAGR
jgi:hypothetical protein